MGSQTRSIICLAAVEDVPAIKRIVLAAYEKYIPRIGKPPAPMTDRARCFRKRLGLGIGW